MAELQNRNQCSSQNRFDSAEYSTAVPTATVEYRRMSSIAAEAPQSLSHVVDATTAVVESSAATVSCILSSQEAAAIALQAAYHAKSVATQARLTHVATYSRTSGRIARIADVSGRQKSIHEKLVKPPCQLNSLSITPCLIYKTYQKALQHSQEHAIPTELCRSPHRRRSPRQRFIRQDTSEPPPCVPIREKESCSFGATTRKQYTKQHPFLSCLTNRQHELKEKKQEESFSDRQNKTLFEDEFRPGMRVEARRDGFDAYQPGKLLADNRDGTCVVLFDGGSLDREVPKLSIAYKSRTFPAYGFSFDVRKVQGGHECWADRFITKPEAEQAKVQTNTRNTIEARTNQPEERTAAEGKAAHIMLTGNPADVIFSDIKLLKAKAQELYPEPLAQNSVVLDLSTLQNDPTIEAFTESATFLSSTEFAEEISGGTIKDPVRIDFSTPMFCANRLQSQLLQRRSEAMPNSSPSFKPETTTRHAKFQEALRSRCAASMHRRKMARQRDMLFSNADAESGSCGSGDDARAHLKSVVEQFSPFSPQNKGRVAVHLYKSPCKQFPQTVTVRQS